MYCTKCGQMVNEEYVFCPRCGNKIKKESLNIQQIPKNQVNSSNLNKINYKEIFESSILDNIYPLRIDKRNRLFKVGVFGQIHPFSDILDVQIYENGSSLQKTKTGSMIGRAAVGSMISPLGAIAGAVTAKKKSVEIINKIEVIVTINDERKPIITIPMNVPKGTKKDSFDYDYAIKNAQKIEAKIRMLMYQQ